MKYKADSGIRGFNPDNPKLWTKILNLECRQAGHGAWVMAEYPHDLKAVSLIRFSTFSGPFSETSLQEDMKG